MHSIPVNRRGGSGPSAQGGESDEASVPVGESASQALDDDADLESASADYSLGPAEVPSAEPCSGEIPLSHAGFRL